MNASRGLGRADWIGEIARLCTENELGDRASSNGSSSSVHIVTKDNGNGNEYYLELILEHAKARGRTKKESTRAKAKNGPETA